MKNNSYLIQNNKKLINSVFENISSNFVIFKCIIYLYWFAIISKIQWLFLIFFPFPLWHLILQIFQKLTSLRNVKKNHVSEFTLYITKPSSFLIIKYPILPKFTKLVFPILASLTFINIIYSANYFNEKSENLTTWSWPMSYKSKL